MDDFLSQKATAINTLFDYLALRDVPELTKEAVEKKLGGPADYLVLFGGSIPDAAKLAACAMKSGAAEKLMIVGGEGHTTQSLRAHMQARFPNMETADLTEAELFDRCLLESFGIRADALEKRSTNCGSNVSFCLELFEKMGPLPKSLILVQDSTMQRRMELTFQKVWDPLPVKRLNFAAYPQRVAAEGGALRYQHPRLWGMWEMDRFLSLLMGEIPRILDDENGYGPKGRGFIAHADLPEAVLEAYAFLKETQPSLVRQADERYARALNQ